MVLTLESKPLDDLDEDDLAALVTDHVAERRTTEFKSALPGTEPKDKLEFVADVSSFANAAGGHIIYGMDAVNGVASRLCGLGALNADAEGLRLQNILRDWSAPRITTAQTRGISLRTGGTVIVLRMPRSWIAPHAVIQKSDMGHRFAFHARNSHGKYSLDIQEVRAAFLGSETAATRLRDFRVDRIAQINAGVVPVSLEPGPLAILHLVPFSAFSLETRYDVTHVGDDPATRDIALPIFSVGGHGKRLTFDGFLRWLSPVGGDTTTSYLHLYRTGALETVWAVSSARLDRKEVPSHVLEELTIMALERYLTLFRAMGVQPPFALTLTLTGLRGFRLGIDQWLSSLSPSLRPAPFDRDMLVFPEMIVTDYEREPADLLRDTFTILWNAVNVARDPYYDADGMWLGARQ